jgi:hypothetical protein
VRAKRLAISAPVARQAFFSTVTARDAFNHTNNHTAADPGTPPSTASHAEAALPADTTLTSGAGTFSATLRLAGAQTLVTTDSASASLAASLTVIAGITVSSDVTGVTDPATPGVASDVTVTARDAVGNVATGSTGTVHLRAPNRSAVLPGDALFTSGDDESPGCNADVTFNRVGDQ